MDSAAHYAQPTRARRSTPCESCAGHVRRRATIAMLMPTAGTASSSEDELTVSPYSVPSDSAEARITWAVALQAQRRPKPSRLQAAAPAHCPIERAAKAAHAFMNWRDDRRVDWQASRHCRAQVTGYAAATEATCSTPNRALATRIRRQADASVHLIWPSPANRLRPNPAP
jgi:hypothetical protein